MCLYYLEIVLIVKPGRMTLKNMWKGSRRHHIQYRVNRDIGRAHINQMALSLKDYNVCMSFQHAHEITMMETQINRKGRNEGWYPLAVPDYESL